MKSISRCNNYWLGMTWKNSQPDSSFFVVSKPDLSIVQLTHYGVVRVGEMNNEVALSGRKTTTPQPSLGHQSRTAPTTTTTTEL